MKQLRRDLIQKSKLHLFYDFALIVGDALSGVERSVEALDGDLTASSITIALASIFFP